MLKAGDKIILTKEACYNICIPEGVANSILTIKKINKSIVNTEEGWSVLLKDCVYYTPLMAALY